MPDAHHFDFVATDAVDNEIRRAIHDFLARAHDITRTPDHRLPKEQICSLQYALGQDPGCFGVFRREVVLGVLEVSQRQACPTQLQALPVQRAKA